jgi:hypothetical protein
MEKPEEDWVLCLNYSRKLHGFVLPLRSNSRTSSTCRANGTSTRPLASHFKTIASLLIDDLALQLCPRCCQPIHWGLGVTFTCFCAFAPTTGRQSPSYLYAGKAFRLRTIHAPRSGFRVCYQFGVAAEELRRSVISRVVGSETRRSRTPPLRQKCPTCHSVRFDHPALQPGSAH